MSYTFQSVKRYKRGARWPDGRTRTCTRCAAEHRPRRRPATVTALLIRAGSRSKVPVGYCSEHIPDQLTRGGESAA